MNVASIWDEISFSVTLIAPTQLRWTEVCSQIELHSALRGQGMNLRFAVLLIALVSLSSSLVEAAGIPLIKHRPVVMAQKKKGKSAKKNILVKPSVLSSSKALMKLRTNLSVVDKKKLSAALMRGRKLKAKPGTTTKVPRFSDPTGVLLSPFKKPRVTYNGRLLGIIQMYDIMASNGGSMFGAFSPSMAKQAKDDFVQFPSFKGRVVANFYPKNESSWKQNVYAYQLQVTVGKKRLFGAETFFKKATLNGTPITLKRLSAGQYGHLFYSDAKNIIVKLSEFDGAGNRFYSISLKRLH